MHSDKKSDDDDSDEEHDTPTKRRAWTRLRMATARGEGEGERSVSRTASPPWFHIPSLNSELPPSAHLEAVPSFDQFVCPECPECRGLPCSSGGGIT